MSVSDVASDSASVVEPCLARLTSTDEGPTDYDAVLHDSVVLLTAPQFVAQSVDWQVAAIQAVFIRMTVSLHAQAGAAAALAAPHFARLLGSPETTLAQACLLHDAMWGMWWCAAASLDDMRPVQTSVCIPFHRFLERRGLVSAGARDAREPGPIKVAYLSHYSHGARGNAVSPVIASLARAHAAIPDRKVFFYSVQWVDEAWLDEQFAATDVSRRNVGMGMAYDRFDELFELLRVDDPDVVIADVTGSIASVLFARRVAPAQLRLDLGLPYWFPPEIDLVLLSGKRWRDCYPFGRDRAVEMTTTQETEFIFRAPSETEIAEARAALPADAQAIGLFTRLIKITPAYLEVIRQVLRRKPDAHFLVGGTGDPRMVQAFMADDELAGRVTFLHRNVNLAAYAHAIDVFVDTFPMIGGLACREIVAQGVPVLSLRSNEWGLKQDQDRDPQSIADDEPALIDLICRTLTDVAFREARAAAAAATIDVISDVATSAAEIDAAMMGALRAAHKRS